MHEYEYSGDKLFYEKRGDIGFYYRYDVNGNIAAITKVYTDGSKFTVYPICNIRGDVEELRNGDGTLYARYVYDSWGNVLGIYDANGNKILNTAHTAVQNPFRYRGYYFDTESGLYYLQSRYYDPVTCRFVNADTSVVLAVSYLSNFNKNLYSYCDNNPSNRIDYLGSSWGIVASLGISFALWYGPEIIENWCRGAKGVQLFMPHSTMGEFMGAMISGVIPGKGFSGAFFSSLTETSIIYIERVLKGEEVSWSGYFYENAISTLIGGAFDMGADWTNNKIDDAFYPRNYSSYAGEQYKKYPGITRDEIERKLGRRGKVINIFESIVSGAFDACGGAISSVIKRGG